MQFINVGFGNLVNADRILAVVTPDAAPVKRMVSRAKEAGTAVDATQGRRTKAVLVLDNGALLLSALQPDTIRRRAQAIVPGAEEGSSAEVPDAGCAADGRG